MIISILKEKTKPEDGTRSLLWYDSVTKKLINFDAHWLDCRFVKDDFIESDDGNLVYLEDAIDMYVEANRGLSRNWAEFFVRKNHTVIQKTRMRAFPRKRKTDSRRAIDIRKWILDYQNYNNTTLDIDSEDDRAFVVTVSYEDSDEACYQMERSGLSFKVED